MVSNHQILQLSELEYPNSSNRPRSLIIHNTQENS
jgi:hypothetical protein